MDKDQIMGSTFGLMVISMMELGTRISSMVMALSIWIAAIIHMLAFGKKMLSFLIKINSILQMIYLWKTIWMKTHSKWIIIHTIKAHYIKRYRCKMIDIIFFI
jgi:hypothetical protein